MVGIAMAVNSQYPEMNPFGALKVKPEGVYKKTRSKGLELIRSYGQLTNSLRVTPDYLIIGTKRGGTTSLARWLTQHKQIGSLFPKKETRKGAYYFDVNYERGLSWYKSFFPTKFAHTLKEKKAGHNILLGDATPYYLYHPHAPSRANDLIPNAKAIALLRNPVERAFSHWVERTRQKVETLPFEEAIKEEAERLNGEEQKMLSDPSYHSFTHQHFSYIDQGKYFEPIQRWMKYYDDKQLLVIRSEDLYDNPKETYSEVLNFLEIEAHEPKEFSAWNKKSKPALEPKIREHLVKEFSLDIQNLEKLLNRKMGWE